MLLLVCVCVCVCVCVRACVRAGGRVGGRARVCVRAVGMRRDRCGWVITVGILVLCDTCIVHNVSTSLHDCSCILRSNFFDHE